MILESAAMPLAMWLAVADQSGLLRGVDVWSLLDETRAYREADTELLAALPALEMECGIERSRTQQTREHLVALYDARGRPDRAALYREEPYHRAVNHPRASRVD